MSSPSLFIASIAGSSWNSDDSSGLPPTVSPAATTSVCLLRRLSSRIVGGEVLGAAGGHAVAAGRLVRLMRPGVLGLEMAVEVVDAEQLHRSGFWGGFFFFFSAAPAARSNQRDDQTSRNRIR